MIYSFSNRYDISHKKMSECFFAHRKKLGMRIHNFAAY